MFSLSLVHSEMHRQSRKNIDIIDIFSVLVEQCYKNFVGECLRVSSTMKGHHEHNFYNQSI